MSVGLPLLFVLVSVALGTLLALVPSDRGRVLGPIRSFAFSSCAAVIAFELFPHAIAAGGFVAVPSMVAGFLLPSLLERLGAALFTGARVSEGARRALALDISLGGLLLHQVGDGVALATIARSGGELLHTATVLGAVTAHTVPVVAAFIVGFRRAVGMRQALWRAVLFAVTAGSGVLLGHAIPTATLEAARGVSDAAVGGLLLHVVLHDLRADPPVAPAGRVLEVAASVAGLALVLGPVGAHHEHGGTPATAIGPALERLALDVAPMLLLGLVLGAALAASQATVPDRWLRARSAPVAALLGALAGAPLPLCSCSVVPFAHGLSARGAGVGFVVAFLVAAPELGIETFTLSFQLLGPELAVARLVAALLAAVAAGWVAAVLASGLRRGGVPAAAPQAARPAAARAPRRAGFGIRALTDTVARSALLEPGALPALVARARAPEVAGPGAAPFACPAPSSDTVSGAAEPSAYGGAEPSARGAFAWLARALHALDDLVADVLGWMLVGLLLTAYLEAMVPASTFAAAAGTWWELPVVSLLSLPSYVCASAATPLAATLMAKGLSTGAALVFLLLGPATNLATIVLLSRLLGVRAMLGTLIGLVAVSWVLALAVGAWLPSRVAADVGPAESASVWSAAALLALAALAVRAVWLLGLRGWMASAFGLGHGDHGHAHGGHAHGGHAHGGHAHGHG